MRSESWTFIWQPKVSMRYLGATVASLCVLCPLCVLDAPDTFRFRSFAFAFRLRFARSGPGRSRRRPVHQHLMRRPPNAIGDCLSAEHSCKLVDARAVAETRDRGARQLAARDDARERSEVLAWIRRDEELPRVDSPRAPAGLGLRPVAKPHLEARALHGQLREDRLDLPAEGDGNPPPLFREGLGSTDEGRPRGGELALELQDPVVAALEVGQFPPERVPPLDDIGQRGAVFPLQAFEQGQALFHLLLAGGRCFDPGRVLPEKSGE